MQIIDIPLNTIESLDTTNDKVETMNDAFILSLKNLGRVDIDYISNLSNKDYLEVINTLKGSIYQNPETWNVDIKQGWETSEEYLSGNLRKKLRIARETNAKYPGQFIDNINALKKLVFKTLTCDDIYITLGSPWIPVKYIHEFILYVLYDAGSNRKIYIDYSKFTNRVLHDKKSGSWKIEYKNEYAGTQRRWHNKFSTRKVEVLDLIERTLNMKSPIIRDKSYSSLNKTHTTYVVNKNETALAIDAQNKLIETFQKWIWSSKKRSDDLLNIYEEMYASTKVRQFDGSFLTFPGLDKDKFTLRDYQKNAVARILFSPNTLLSHDVGSGKTFIMISSGMELKRMGLSKKNLYVVPNSILIQWRNMFKKLYPSANILTVTPNVFKPANRKNCLKMMRDNDYDAILIGYSSFEQIKLSKKFTIARLREEYANIDQDFDYSYRLGSRKARLDAKIEKLSKDIPDDSEDDIFFDDLNINRLFVDEAHNFKNVPIESKTVGILGINFDGSKKCEEMLNKVICIQKNNNGGGIIFATGTPITNSITDAYVMQYYLQRGELKLLNLESFDAWVAMFAERNTEFEIDVDTASYRVATRFSKFHNLPELTSMFASIADFHHLDQRDGLPEFKGYNDETIEKSFELSYFLKEISSRADKVRNNKVLRVEDNLLKITSDGRKAALDIRLVKTDAPFSTDSKVWKCASNVARIYFETIENKCAQLIFCDTSTPKDGFNIYDELKRLLINKGVLESHIAYVHDATTEAKKEELFKSVSSGDIRVLIGSTFKLGLGVNVQEKLVALHHIDVPWRPADMRQREGRILRQGNTNKEVEIYRYITKGSFDAYSWQLLETKQRFIDNLLSGSMSNRATNDISDTVLNYAEVKALAIGNPLIKERVETYNELNKYLMLQKQAEEKRSVNIARQSTLPSKIDAKKETIANIELDINAYKDYLSTDIKYDDLDKDGKAKYDEDRKKVREFINVSLLNNVMSIKEKNLITYKGFKIILPANMFFDKPFIYIERANRYSLEMGSSDTGNLVRIDNFLNNLDNYLEKQKEELRQLNEERALIIRELNNPVDYKKDIVELTEKLEKLDKKLGVNKDEKK